MLSLKEIKKDYVAGTSRVNALKGVSLNFRKNEFVSILGPSGCGKTTLLNIIGGLDRYTEGDLMVTGKSTKEFKNRDWDTYRNHSVGFVFQSYNLIPHQSVLSNVELALTLSGVSKSERRKRAKEALEKVGLGDQIRKKPNQLSGGQMQRVAIARAIVNDPEILLADEPTGALDTKTSIQIMELLKDIAKDRLIIMVTHNPELANEYSTRIINLLDGKVTGDSNPLTDEEYILQTKKHLEDIESGETATVNKGKKKKTSMSFWTATSLSTKNLMTKKGRTFLTAFAGSIGIIGIALILSLSNGLQEYINRVQEETLSSYPITIQSESVDYSAMITTMMGMREAARAEERDTDTVYSNNIMTNMMSSVLAELTQNDLKSFKEYLDDENSEIRKYISDIHYSYSIPINLYVETDADEPIKVNPVNLMQEMMGVSYGSSFGSSMSTSMMSNSSVVFTELLDNQDLLKAQYDVVQGRLPERYDEMVLFVTDNNEISDYSLYTLNLKDRDELKDIMTSLVKEEEFETSQSSYTYDELLNNTYKLVLPTDYFKYDEDTQTWKDQSDSTQGMKDIVKNAKEIRIVGILRPNPDAVANSVTGTVGYMPSLTRYVIDEVEKSDIVRDQREREDTDIFTGLPFKTEDDEEVKFGMDEVQAYMMTLPEEERAQMQQYLAVMTEDEIVTMFAAMAGKATTDATYDGNMDILCVTDPAAPSKINIYANTFEDKDMITQIIDQYNADMEAAGNENMAITYADYVGLLMSSVSTIINAISYILIAFVGISLVVSSIMIGIITYISVLERTKEIGILRSIGASKRDISRVFNAETLIIGFSAGLLGVVVTMLLDIPANIIIESLSGISNVAKLPLVAAGILVLISMFLTSVAGLIPAKIAAKKDPVVALRSE
ncbi:MAG: ABC transporter ATP-binding protein/permease [Lachnospiraceae bacterium]|nr:ABC transporter ATP-binding protein/permease [Candidatus Merdinaster equi]